MVFHQAFLTKIYNRMNIVLLKQEVIKAYQRVYLHQEIEKQKRGYKTSSTDIEKRLLQLKKLIEEIDSSRNTVCLCQELERCHVYFHLHPEAQKLPLPINVTQDFFFCKGWENYILQRKAGCDKKQTQ
ncbi:hypothetical protein M23134_07035 [Microscilla marina ATCC 23134]|uniref:Uncharacterized protein n=2 Tax=Microscilla marina TaxID=1027 RepID=A1ZT49_MICM2|nr:hypothetical protein M23134_07035 [Microscilla marina ATCC 23134]